MPRKWNVVVENRFGNVRGWGVTKRMPPYSSSNETPMAVIRIAILGALRSGR